METQKFRKTSWQKAFLILGCILLVGLVYAESPPAIPPLPDHFIGNVRINGQDAPIGTQINVYVNSELKSTSGISEAGKYDLFVTTGSTGNIIEFKIQNLLAGSSTRQGGEEIYLNLSIITETSDDTSSDSNNNGGSGGRGGGSSSGSTSTYKTTSESNATTGNFSENDTQYNKTSNIPIQNNGFFSITGKAIAGFTKSGAGKGIIVVAIIIIIGVILIKHRKYHFKKWIKR